MRKIDVIAHFGTQTEVTRVLGISKAFVSQWGDTVPEKYALLLEKITDGALAYDPAVYGRTFDTPPVAAGDTP